MSRSALTTQETIELQKFKAPEVPNNDDDAVEAARKAARARREAGRRENVKVLQPFFDEEVQSGVRQFDAASGRMAVVSSTDTEHETQVENTIEESSIAASPDTIEEIDEESANAKITRVINGKKVTKTLNEWLGLADTAIAQPASKATPVTPAPQPVIPTVEEVENPADDAELVRAIQEGTPEEAAAALKTLRQQSSELARHTIAKQSVQARAKQIVDQIISENTDITGDSDWLQLCYTKDRELATAETYEGTPTDEQKLAALETRFRKAVALVRAKVGGIKQQTEASVKREELIAKKKKLLNVRANNAKVDAPVGDEGPRVFGDRDDPNAAANYAAHVAAQMSRKQGHKRKVNFVS